MAKHYVLSGLVYFTFLDPGMGYGAENGLLIKLNEILLLGLILGLVLTFFILSVLSKIKPYVLCGFWFVSLLLLYAWRSGYVFLLIPALADDTSQNIYFFVLQSVPLVIYLLITKAVTVLQVKDYKLFQKIFTVFLGFSITYLASVVLVSLVNVQLIVRYFHTVQIVFWIFLGLLGIPSLAWLVLSSRKNLNFFKFQTSFGLLFITSLLGKFLLSPSDFPSAFLKPGHLLVGIGVQLLYMFWLLLKSIFESQDEPYEEEEFSLPERMPKLQTTDNSDRRLIGKLSSREMDVITAYCNGFSYSEISSSFLISPNTVKSHLKSCYRKLEINSKVEAINIMNKSH